MGDHIRRRQSMLPTFGPARRCAPGGAAKRRESMAASSSTSTSAISIPFAKSSSRSQARRPLQPRQYASSIPPPSVNVSSGKMGLHVHHHPIPLLMLSLCT